MLLGMYVFRSFFFLGSFFGQWNELFVLFEGPVHGSVCREMVVEQLIDAIWILYSNGCDGHMHVGMIL